MFSPRRQFRAAVFSGNLRRGRARACLSAQSLLKSHQNEQGKEVERHAKSDLQAMQFHPPLGRRQRGRPLRLLRDDVPHAPAPRRRPGPRRSRRQRRGLPHRDEPRRLRRLRALQKLHPRRLERGDQRPGDGVEPARPADGAGALCRPGRERRDPFHRDAGLRPPGADAPDRAAAGAAGPPRLPDRPGLPGRRDGLRRGHTGPAGAGRRAACLRGPDAGRLGAAPDRADRAGVRPGRRAER